MHHVALRTDPARFGALIARLKELEIEHSMHGSADAGSVYVRDPDGILVEVTTGY